MRFRRFILQMLIAVTVIFAVASEKSQARTPTRNLRFKGSALGGSLVVAWTRNRDQQYVSISTSAGESAESVARRMADAINAWNAAPSPGYEPLWGGDFQASADGGTLRLLYGYWAIAGTETGLGIPKPPLSLSCSYDKSTDKIHLRWINPPQGYDSIRFSCFSTKARRSRYSDVLLGTSTSITIPRGIIDVDEFDAHVIGIRDDLLSNSASVRLSNNGCCQSEIYGIPFAGGVAPNWTVWSSASKAETSAFEQTRKYEGHFATMYTLLGKTLHQTIKAAPAGVVHGVKRQFLGLTPGHTYRLTAAVSTLKMDSIKSAWSLSVCAAPNGTDGKELTVQQLAGLVALPNGGSGAEAGRVVSYGPRNTSRGIWEVAVTNHKLRRKPTGANITLPAGVDSVTVWLRFSCSDATGEIAFAGVQLEDLTAAGSNVPTPEEVIEKERKEQAEYRGGEAWLKERTATQ